MSEASPTDEAALADARAMIARWVEVWQRAGSELEEQRHARLAGMDTSEMRRSIHMIFGSLPPPPLRPSSGLVEMQRLLSRLP